MHFAMQDSAELDPGEVELPQALLEALRNDESLLPLVLRAVQDALYFRNPGDLQPSIGVRVPELCCLKEMDLIYRTAISRAAGTDCSTEALAVKFYLNMTFPGLWEMMKGKHPLHEIGSQFVGPKDGATLILRVVDWSLSRASQVRSTKCPSCDKAWRIIMLNSRSLAAFE